MREIKEYRLKPLQVDVIIYDEQDIEFAKVFCGTSLQSGGGTTTLWMSRECQFRLLQDGDIIIRSSGKYSVISRFILDESFEEVV